MKNIPSMVEYEPDVDVQNTGDGVVDEPERFEVASVGGMAQGR